MLITEDTTWKEVQKYAYEKLNEAIDSSRDYTSIKVFNNKDNSVQVRAISCKDGGSQFDYFEVEYNNTISEEENAEAAFWEAIDELKKLKTVPEKK